MDNDAKTFPRHVFAFIGRATISSELSAGRLSALAQTSYPCHVRILLAQELWDNVREEVEAEPFTPDQNAELNRRLKEFEAGEIKGISWEEVRRSLMSRK